ncbi:unnamed protein product [Polarella glacialis]|uniref:phosphoserine transaminase n=1 Tax=Polarella glacialis TaxID=89957 RepID=A0A813H3N6_POLGL|nr:unnamed protein product [Polarella glacialis]CAE8735560.1 unnamed protein product [Polarella glacialis]
MAPLTYDLESFLSLKGLADADAWDLSGNLFPPRTASASTAATDLESFFGLKGLADADAWDLSGNLFPPRTASASTAATMTIRIDADSSDGDGDKSVRSDGKLGGSSSGPVVHNFSAGPATMLDGVLRQVAYQLEDFEGTGMSILEMGHRDTDGPVQRVISEATTIVQSLLRVPANYAVMWMQGGAHGQFAAVPLNLLGDKIQADYIDTGVWSNKAMTEASKFCSVRVAATAAENGFQSIPPVSEWDLSDDSAYVHICANDTINGLEFLEDPDVGDKLLVGDFTSTLLSRRVQISRYAALYCSSGKNLGPAGVCLVIVRKDLLDRAKAYTPVMLHWKAYAETTPIPSLVNTPPVFAIYTCSLVLKTLQNQWGACGDALAALERRVEARAALVYSCIDRSSGFYVNKVLPENRSRMSICFTFCEDADVQRKWGGSITATVELTLMEQRFRREAQNRGMSGVEGHPAFGGIRVCLYNGVSDEAVEEVVRLMSEFPALHA